MFYAQSTSAVISGRYRKKKKGGRDGGKNTHKNKTKTRERERRREQNSNAAGEQKDVR